MNRDWTCRVSPQSARFLTNLKGASSATEPFCQPSGVLAMERQEPSHERTPGTVKRLVFRARKLAVGAGGQDRAAWLGTRKPKAGSIGSQTLAAVGGQVAPTTTSGALGQSLEEGQTLRKETRVPGRRGAKGAISEAPGQLRLWGSSFYKRKTLHLAPRLPKQKGSGDPSGFWLSGE